jgi:hypothetical protein
MMSLGEQARKLTQLISTIGPNEARQRINDAYIRNAQDNPWAHLLRRFTLETEPPYNTGTIAIIQNTIAVTLTGGAWVVSWGTAPSMRRMEIQGRREPYDVTVFGSTTSATLADTYPGADLTAGGYNIYRDTYPLPADCGYAKVMALYDPSQRSDIRFPTDRGRLLFFNQSRFLKERAAQNTLTGIPYCFTMMQQTSETPPRPQLQLFPAPSDVRVYHGWYFRRPAIMASDGVYPDWPEEFEDMHWCRAAVEYYETPGHFSQRFGEKYSSKLAVMFRKMKTEMDGQSAMENEIQGTHAGMTSYSPTFYGSNVAGSVSWK